MTSESTFEIIDVTGGIYAFFETDDITSSSETDGLIASIGHC